MREHRDVTLLLNVLVNGRTSVQPLRSEHVWADVSGNGGPTDIKWVRQNFWAKLPGNQEAVVDELSPPATKQIDQLEPAEYYAQMGDDGTGLRLPTDLDEAICLYQQLPPSKRPDFNHAAFCLCM